MTILFLPRFHTIVLATSNVIERALEVFPRLFQPAGILCRVEVGMDQLDQSIQIFGCNGIVLLVEVIDVAVQNFDEELDRDGRVHAGVCNAESTL